MSGSSHAHLFRLQRHDAARPRGDRGRDRGDPPSVRQRLERASFRAARQGRAGRRALGGRGARPRRPVGDRLHERRHRVRQLRDPRRGRSARAHGTPASGRQRDRARGGPQHPEGAGAARLAHLAGARRRDRHRRSGSIARAGHEGHGARLGDAREQRNRHDSADRGALGHRPRARRRHAHRRRAIGREDSGGRARARRRPAVVVGAQVQRTEGRRRACGSSAARGCSR